MCSAVKTPIFEDNTRRAEGTLQRINLSDASLPSFCPVNHIHDLSSLTALHSNFSVVPTISNAWELIATLSGSVLGRIPSIGLTHSDTDDL